MEPLLKSGQRAYARGRRGHPRIFPVIITGTYHTCSPNDERWYTAKLVSDPKKERHYRWDDVSLRRENLM